MSPYSYGSRPGNRASSPGQSAAEQRIAVAERVIGHFRREFGPLVGDDGGRCDHVLAYADGALERVLRALQGETRPERLRFEGPMPLPPRPVQPETPAGPEQEGPGLFDLLDAS